MASRSSGRSSSLFPAALRHDTIISIPLLSRRRDSSRRRLAQSLSAYMPRDDLNFPRASSFNRRGHYDMPSTPTVTASCAANIGIGYTRRLFDELPSHHAAAGRT